METFPKMVKWLNSEIKSPPFTLAGRIAAGKLIRSVQMGETLGMPLSRPMPSIGSRCHELRVRDDKHNWRIIYRIDSRFILVAHIFPKTTPKTPKTVIAVCKSRLAKYDRENAE